MRDRLAAYFAEALPAGVVAAWLFGSHARGTTHAGSDVDVGVLLDWNAFPTRPARNAERERLTTDLITALHVNAIDVVVLNDASPELVVAAVDSGELVLDTDAEAVHTFVRTARLRYADIRPFLDRMRKLKLDAIAR